jgi:hypothetical protein
MGPATQTLFHRQNRHVRLLEPEVVSAICTAPMTGPQQRNSFNDSIESMDFHILQQFLVSFSYGIQSVG